jgi:hypothetical protein
VTQGVLTAAVRRKRGSLEPLVITALFDTSDAADEALRRLYSAGVPRDLIEIVVSRGGPGRV